MTATPEPWPCLSVVVPCFDEAATVAALLDRVLGSPWTAEVVVVDDASTDGTAAVLAGVGDDRVRVIRHDRNQGKGAALRTGFAAATAEFVIVQDADLEYDPADYGVVLEPLVTGRADMETCYKAFRREVIQAIEIEEDRFGFEPEITAKLARRHLRIYEVGIAYAGRTYDEGKKIGWRDGVRALVCIVRYSAAGDRLRAVRPGGGGGGGSARRGDRRGPNG